MSKIKELFGVEIGEEFKLKDKLNNILFSERYCFDFSGHLCRTDFNLPENESTSRIRPMEILLGWYEIVKPILTDEEREYLRAICNPDFIKGRIINIEKYANGEGTYRIEIDTTEGANIFSFYFTKDLFKGMEFSKPYTPEELGL